MASNDDLDALWNRLKDAKLALDLAFNYLQEVNQDLRGGFVPAPDGLYAQKRALRAERLAMQNYAEALNAFKTAALATRIKNAPNAPTELG